MSISEVVLDQGSFEESLSESVTLTAAFNMKLLFQHAPQLDASHEAALLQPRKETFEKHHLQQLFAAASGSRSIEIFFVKGKVLGREEDR